MKTMKMKNIKKAGYLGLPLIVTAVAAVLSGIQADFSVLSQFEKSISPEVEQFLKNSSDATCKKLPLNFIQFQLDAAKKLAGSATSGDEKRLLASAFAVRAKALAKLISDRGAGVDGTYEDDHKSTSGKTLTSSKILSGGADDPEFYQVRRGTVSTYGTITNEQLIAMGLPAIGGESDKNKNADKFRALAKSFSWATGTAEESTLLAVGVGKHTGVDADGIKTGYGNLIHTADVGTIFSTLYPATVTADSDDADKKFPQKLIDRVNHLINTQLKNKSATEVALYCKTSMVYANDSLRKDGTVASKDVGPADMDGGNVAVDSPAGSVTSAFMDLPLINIPNAGDLPAAGKKRDAKEKQFKALLSHCPMLAESILTYVQFQTDKETVAKGTKKASELVTANKTGAPCYEDFRKYIEKL